MTYRFERRDVLREPVHDAFTFGFERAEHAILQDEDPRVVPIEVTGGSSRDGRDDATVC